MAKKKRHLRKSVKITGAAVLAAVLGISAFAILRKKESAAVPEPAPVPEETAPAETPVPQPQIFTASMYMIGDALPQRSYLQDAKTETGYDFSVQADGITNIASNYDIAYYNQEVILGGDDLGFTIWPHMNAPRAFGEYMLSKGFNLISTANNHSLDKDLAGVVNSCEFWRSHPEAVTAGLNLSQEERNAIPVYEKNGITYAFTSWTYGMNMYSQPEGKPYTVNCYRGHEEEMLNWVRLAKEKADVVIVAMHWGEEYHFDPNDEQKRLAQQLADAGADIIIGNHPHNIQPVQWLNDHQTICFYALGNCLSSQTVKEVTSYKKLNTGMAASLVIEKTMQPDGSSKTVIKDLKTELLFTWHTGDFEHMHSVFYNELNDEILPGYQEYYEYLKENVVRAMDDTIELGF